MRLVFRVLLMATACAIASPVNADTWADTKDSAYAKSSAICRKLKALKLPAAIPADAKATACDSSDLYYGIKHPADPAAARVCALAHRASATADQDDPFDGAGLLTTIYANGKGAPRDLDVAIGFACLLDGAPAEMDARILRLDALRSTAKPAADFDICDDATSGQLAGACASLDADRADAKRERVVAALEAQMTAPQKAALAPLRKAAAAYVAAVGENEVDSSGTLRGAMVVGAEQEEQIAFMKTLQATIEGSLPKADAKAFAAADRALNTAYGVVMRVKDPSAWGTVGKSGIKTVQIAWLAYRDAFVTFAKAVGHEGGAEALKTRLTAQRTEALGNFAP